MNLLWFFIPVALLLVFLIPTAIELFRRKDKGPRFVPDITIYEEADQFDSVRDFVGTDEVPIEKKGGDTSVPDGTEIQGNLVVKGNLKIGNNCLVHGTLKAYGRIDIGEFCIIDGSVLSREEVVVGARSQIGFVIVSLRDVTLGDNVVADAVTTEKTVQLGKGVIINKKIVGTAVVHREAEAQGKKSSEEEGAI